ncbi:putative GATA transcription factor 22 [Coffea eugenioides]|uniref:putative GATA transcription factor 22 n=1 Tax=Coffea eugenioides TaxID=49369 RepID=UPI000F60A619|nr:putative GATA transcription factor 22 [Coffea eugenioides]
MIPNYLTSASPSPFSVRDPIQDHDEHDRPQLFFPNYQTASSSSVSSSGFRSIAQDQTEDYHAQMHQQRYQQQVENHAPYTGSQDPEKKANKGSKISLRKNNTNGNQADYHEEINPVNNKWVSSKVKLMQKMNKPDLKEITSSTTTAMKFEDHQKQPTSASPEADHFSSNSSSNISNTPIRVCADCNTTKTPLWRSGPKGPKSLCNACGIRQRKARRAMAAAAAAANGTSPPTYDTTAPLKVKVQNKDKLKSNGQFKKRCKLNTSAESSQNLHAVQKKSGFEDFLFNLSKNLAFHRVFPQDEKEAAILLMALSCGLVHG